VLAITPARGGSKGVPRKNVRLLAGKPLIGWTLEAAQRCRGIDRVVVSTDDDEIAMVAGQFGAQVIRRPAEIALDASPTEPAIFHVLDTLEAEDGYVPDAVALLQCTSPLRGTDVIDACLRMLHDTGCDAVMTVTPMQHWYLAGQVTAGGVYQPGYDYLGRPRSQEMPEKVRENGAVYVTRREALRRYGNRLGGDVRVVVLDVLHSVDIDSEEDFRLAEEAIRGLSVH
jgi:N-acylneuraminate cytidylyltransferase